MSYFLIKPHKILSDSYYIDAAHKWRIPPIRCHVCRNTISYCLSYPSIELDSIPVISELSAYVKPPIASRERYEELKGRVRLKVGEDKYLLPGTELGPLVGTGEGKRYDFMWLWPWWPMMQEEAFNKLLWAGFMDLAAGNAEIKWKRAKNFKMIELDIPVAGSINEKMFNSSWKETCSACGRGEGKLPEHLVFKKNDLPENMDIFRIPKWPSIILLSERLAKAIIDLKFTNVVLKQVELV